MFTNSEMIYIPPRNGYTTSEAAGAISLTLSRLTIVSPLRLRLVGANLSPLPVVNNYCSLLPNFPVPFTRSTKLLSFTMTVH